MRNFTTEAEQVRLIQLQSAALQKADAELSAMQCRLSEAELREAKAREEVTSLRGRLFREVTEHECLKQEYARLNAEFDEAEEELDGIAVETFATVRE